MDADLLPAPRRPLAGPARPPGTPSRDRRAASSCRRQRALASPVRLVAPEVASPFAPGRDVVFARLSGRLLEDAGLRDGDHVALARRDRAEAGSFAAVTGVDGSDGGRGRGASSRWGELGRSDKSSKSSKSSESGASLWRVYPEGARLRLTTGGDLDPEHPERARATGRRARVQGIVVGVLRKLCG